MWCSTTGWLAPEILLLARPDAEQIYVGKHEGEQEKIPGAREDLRSDSKQDRAPEKPYN